MVYSNEFVGGSYEYKSKAVNTSRSVNLYPEVIEDAGGKVSQTLVSLAGVVKFVQLGRSNAVCRAIYVSSTGVGGEPHVWAVFGNKLYRINEFGESVVVDTIGEGISNVSLTDNGFDVVLVSGENYLRTYNMIAEDDAVAASRAIVSLPTYSWGGSSYPIRPTKIRFLNQRLIINGADKAGFGVMFYSEPASTSFVDQFGVVNMFSSESSGDALVTFEVFAGSLWLFGKRSFEVWSPSQFGFLAYSSGSALEYGCSSARSVAVLGEFIYWVGSSSAGQNVVFRSSGATPQRISTGVLEREISSFKEGKDLQGFTYQTEGHQFYVLTSVGDRRTVCFDGSTNLWHDRATRIWNTGDLSAWEPLYCVSSFGKTIYGSTTGALLTLDKDSYRDSSGHPLFRQRVSPIYWSEGNPICIREVLLDIEVGTTPELNIKGERVQGGTPKAILEVSKDGGYTWFSLPAKSLGAQGNYTQTVKWHSIGVARNFSFRLTITEPINITISGLRLETEQVRRR